MEPKEIGVFDTKTHLSEIIEKVERGQRFYITKRGRRVAELRPAPADRQLVRGCAKNPNYKMASDFDDTPDDLSEYT